MEQVAAVHQRLLSLRGAHDCFPDLLKDYR